MFMIMSMSLMTSVLFTMMKHPLSMGMTLIVQTMITSLIAGLMMGSFWYSYILAITMLSGALVLFIYMASVASNEKFYTSWILIIISTMTMITSMVLTFFVDQSKLSKIWSTKKMLMIKNDQTLSLIELFSSSNVFITIMLVCYLFFTMIAITYIVNVHEGPLRMKS